MWTLVTGCAPPAFGGGRSSGSHVGHSAGRGSRKRQRRERIADAIEQPRSGRHLCEPLAVRDHLTRTESRVAAEPERLWKRSVWRRSFLYSPSTTARRSSVR